MKTDKRLLSGFLCTIICIMMLVTMLPVRSFAAENNGKVVRVAYALVPGYQEGGEGEYKSGYGYEYLQKLATINGWKYEYVYGSFNELFEKLQRGEVDLMGNLTYSDARAKTISFGTYEQGKDGTYLYVNKNHVSIDPTNYASLNGKSIGVCTGQIQEEELRNWCEAENIVCSIVEYDYFSDCKKALNDGKIDAAVDGKIQLNADTIDWDAQIVINTSPFYFGVSTQRPDILSEVNAAQKKILDENPFYNETVQNRYLKPVALATTNLNTAEKKWLKEHDNPIRFGYLEGFAPLCYTDTNGNCQGVAADVVASIEQKYAEENIQFEAVAFSDYYTMFDALRNGTIAAAWPAYDDYWNAEQRGYAITDCVVNTSMFLVYDGKYTDDTTAKIGVINTGSLPKIYGNIHYPQSEIKEYDSYKSAIQAVLRKEISSVLYVSTTYNVDVANDDVLQKMNMVVLPDSFGISFAVSPGSEELNSILDKGIAIFGEAGVNHSLIINSAVDKEFTLKNYFNQHPIIANLLISLLLALVAGTIYSRMSSRIKTSQKEKELYERISNTDPLTGLHNRQAVFNKCQELLQDHPDDQFVMTHIDMSHFRLFNTFFGDEAGDKLLCDTANLLRGLSKDYDYWAYGRIEADVFCAFFPYDEKKYQKHLTAMLQYLKNYRSDFLIEPKIGMYFVADPEMPMESMFTRASLAAKEVQPGTPYATVIFDEKLEKGLNEKQQILNDMQTAIDEKQFVVYLQPKYALRTNKLVGAEALVRWIHPAKGMISPGIFIPIFESNGFITTLDRYMWEHVCRILSDWKKSGKPMAPVSVNVSRLSMFGSTTVEFLKELVKKYDIDPRYLELELTESAYMDDPEEMKLQMYALKKAGFTILLDDFGSGYSSLNTLREIPVDVLKLDMKFLSLDQSDIRGSLVISSIVRMAKLLHLLVIAEGVETHAQADYLREVDCEYVQGFLFSRPIPVSEYETLLTSSSKPLDHVNQPTIDHIGRILAETGSATYAMGTVIPTPLACLEYVDREFRFLRANPAFYAEFRPSEDSQPMSAVFKKHLTEESYADFIKALEDSVQRGKEVRTPIIWNTDDGKQSRYICTIMYEGNIGATATLVVTYNNVTNMVHSNGADEWQKHSPEMEGRLWNYVKSMVSANDVNAVTNSIIREVMNYYDADRAYIFEFDWDKNIGINTHEVCAPAVEPMIDFLQEVPLSAMGAWTELFNKNSLIQIKDLNELIGDESRKAEYDILEPQGIQSLIAAPVFLEKKLVGFLGIDNPKQNLDDTGFIEGLAFLCLNESLHEKEKTDLEIMSLIDPLTGAYNRKAWEQEQRRLLENRTPFSLLMLDVDNYKQVNDRFGHQIGDEILKRIVSTLKELFRADDMVIRYGGDEFLVVLEDAGSKMEKALIQKVERLNEILSQPTEQLPGIFVSAGIASSDSGNAEDLFRNADNALYHVKNSGKKGWHIYKDGNS